MPEIAQTKLKFSEYLWKYGPNNILKVLENPLQLSKKSKMAFKMAVIKKISCMLEITNKLKFSLYL